MPIRFELNKPLAAIIEMTQGADTHPIETPISGLFVIGGDVPAHQLAALYQPMIGFVLQGTKRMLIGEHSINVSGPGYFLLPMHLPVTATVHSDGNGNPYRSIGLDLDLTILQGLLRDVGGGRTDKPVPFTACRMNGEIADALFRLMRLAERPSEISALASVYKREVFYRVLTGPQGDSLRQFALRESNFSRIERTVQWLRRNFDKSMDVRDVARETGMAVTTFHRQFKQATGLSPVQFQKQLRLLEARNLIAHEGLAVSNAAYKVGYESPSQFNREYSRFFGSSPSKHSKQIRKEEAERLS
ncbi:MAG: AraC family transcriptional regulator N-terminal domain-containing protein [Pyrinomonadaceae bacterium]